MPRPKRTLARKSTYKMESESSSDSDFDEDPDKIEVPGGGKDLEALKTEVPPEGDGGSASTKLGLVTKDHAAGAYEMLKMPPGPGGALPMAPQMPFGGQINPQSLFGPQSMFGGLNPAQLFPMEFASLGQSLFNPFLMASASNLPNGSVMQQLMNMGGWGALGPKAWPKQELKEPLDEEEAAEEEEEMGVAETYADYMPTKLKVGKKHPDPVVETASLSSVAPTDVWYELQLPDETIRTGSLSALQLEAIVYSSQQHSHFLPDGSRAGFLIGDGAGVGKGRTIAGIIFENYLRGRKKALWISVSNDLKYDSERDLRDIGASKIDVYALNKLKYAKISSPVNNNVKKGVIFSTYSALIGESNQTGGKYKSRLKQLIQWCGEDFDGCIIFDECHRAKNLCPVGSSKPTKTGLTVLEIQKRLPKARVVYASATGASEPRNMAYMVRLGMWGEGSPFREFNDFINAVEKRGVGAMEIVAMDMKLRGMYIARQLSFHGVTFKVDEVKLTDELMQVYDQSVKLWVEAMRKFQDAAELVDAEQRMKKTMWGQFWSSHQRFFKYLCIAAKVKHAVQIAREAVKYGKCVVIGLQSTGEARTLEQLDKDDGELSDFVSTAKGVMQTLVEKHFPAPDRNRIQRLLGIEAPPKEANGGGATVEDPDDLQAGSSSGNKRKPLRRAAAKANKRVRMDSDSGSDVRSSGSEFQMTSSENSESEEHSEEESNSDDFNPFDEDSDSDADPWVKKRKAVKPKDKVAKHLASKVKAAQSAAAANPSATQAKPWAPPRDAIERACAMKDELLAAIERLGEKLPPNTLDQLIDELGGPENVAEMTGRKGRVVQNEDGTIQYESRSEADVPLETLNLTEKQRFMDGEKDVAIISEAASSGISLQSDRRAKNQRRRVHITLELPWSADRAIQQFGRTHRSNQVNAPEYVFLISDLAGERRFASIVAKRLESLGALTHGDRRATESRDLSRFNIDNKYGRTALEATMKAIMGYEAPLVPPPSDYNGDFFKDVADALVGVGLITGSDATPGMLALDKDYNNMSKFLNRILGMPVELQNRLFQYFTDTLAAIVQQAKKTGRYDLGILDLGAGGEHVKRVRVVTFLRPHATGKAVTELHTVSVERGMSWEEVQEKAALLIHKDEGFYLSHQVRNDKHTAILAIADQAKQKDKKDKKDSLFTIYRPNTGLQLRQESRGELLKKYKKASPEEAEESWKQQYQASEKICSHAYWRGNCRTAVIGGECEVGLRRRTYHVLSGSVLAVWSRVEGVLTNRANAKMQVIRLRTAEGLKIVGTLIPTSCYELLKESLSSDSEKTEEQTF
ncbi:protein strawberry notch [Neocloeon triangulifer]|uniref:protein strawberry notch n=1 Tax=Neocloeon triangulifer TaxID=2078957 RepID=UPI00286F9850|nr:protein strawberry notch [Neocloeon triangulifer]